MCVISTERATDINRQEMLRKKSVYHVDDDGESIY